MYKGETWDRVRRVLLRTNRRTLEYVLAYRRTKSVRSTRIFGICEVCVIHVKKKKRETVLYIYIYAYVYIFTDI